MAIRRRDFLALSTTGLTTALVTGAAEAQQPQSPASPNDRPGIGAIGMRYQGSVITEKASAHGDVVAIADVDRHVREQARAAFGSTPWIAEDYRHLLDRKDVDVVMIGAPDHWHSKMVVDACRAGKDVYVEKPLTLTVDEGKTIQRVVAETGRVVQVGSWQRSDHRFRLAAEMVRAGRIGKLERVTCTTDKNPSGGPFPVRPVPLQLNWDLWQGQSPDVPYIEQRCHYTFRWWYEYAGGKMTDWGAHHLDIAQWAIGELPVKVDAQGTFPSVVDGYNVATDMRAVFTYPSGVELVVLDEGRRGILFEGDQGRIFVNRSILDGSPVEALVDDPLPAEKYSLYPHDDPNVPPRAGKLDSIVNHAINFFSCIRTRRTPISDVVSQHQSAATCHLANISMRLGRPLTWNPRTEQFDGDAEADTWLAREQRKGFEV